MLQKADFERHGFLKEQSRTVLSTDKAGNNSVYTETLYYFKLVQCSEVQIIKVVMEIEELLPG